ncbi:hypothetical protein TNIN_420941 [Trichonephila inaurata madagascariensis]|uniref:Uncharacterized protein n=1 Tax=Trichonephila inaurata madagascariensis TaxID=2747483 RepID=A0A8X6YQQ4_9ARAC|nr:hypothetical protein TNIN_420941 [Trichonephila inaurata madagascariensis]
MSSSPKDTPNKTILARDIPKIGRLQPETPASARRLLLSTFIMARKKILVIQQRSGNNYFQNLQHLTLIERIPAEHMESQPRTPASLASTPLKENENVMEFSLPSSTRSSRPRTPQDLDPQTIRPSNCRKLQLLATMIKSHAADVESSKQLINVIISKGYTKQDPFLLETYQRLEDCSLRHQQAVSEFASHPPYDTPGCTIHSTLHSTPVKENLEEFPPLPKSVKRKDNEDVFTSPLLRENSFKEQVASHSAPTSNGSASSLVAEHPSSPGKKVYRSLATGLDPQSINMAAPATPVIEKTVMLTDRTHKLSELNYSKGLLASTSSTLRKLLLSIWDGGFHKTQCPLTSASSGPVKSFNELLSGYFHFFSCAHLKEFR